MNCFVQRERNELIGLNWIHRFGWLRATELGALMWPGDKYSDTRGSRLASNLIKGGVVIPRQLPAGAGFALVLSGTGVKKLNEIGIDAKSGKDFGDIKSAKWVPPSGWQHDLIATGVLSNLYRQGFAITPEFEIRANNPGISKIPDGIADSLNGRVYWLEVEHARKTGKAMEFLAKSICDVSGGNGRPIGEIRPTGVLIAFLHEATDERLYRLDHKLRITQAIKRYAQKSVRLTWAECKLRGWGVASVEFKEEVILNDATERYLHHMNQMGWQRNEDDIYWIQYGDRRAEFWHDETMGWSYCVDRCPAFQVDSMSECKRGCADLIAAASKR